MTDHNETPTAAYEELARNAGWKPYSHIPGAWVRDGIKSPCGRYVDMVGANSAKDACEKDGLILSEDAS